MFDLWHRVRKIGNEIIAILYSLFSFECVGTAVEMEVKNHKSVSQGNLYSVLIYKNFTSHIQIMAYL